IGICEWQHGGKYHVRGLQRSRESGRIGRHQSRRKRSINQTASGTGTSRCKSGGWVRPYPVRPADLGLGDLWKPSSNCFGTTPIKKFSLFLFCLFAGGTSLRIRNDLVGEMPGNFVVV